MPWEGIATHFPPTAVFGGNWLGPTATRRSNLRSAGNLHPSAVTSLYITRPFFSGACTKLHAMGKASPCTFPTAGDASRWCGLHCHPAQQCARRREVAASSIGHLERHQTFLFRRLNQISCTGKTPARFFPHCSVCTKMATNNCHPVQQLAQRRKLTSSGCGCSSINHSFLFRRWALV